MTHSELVALAHRWLKSHGYLAFTEFTTSNPETPDAIGWKAGESALIECKMSASDFNADAKKWFREHPDFGMGRLRYYLCPHGLITPEMIPENWGLIWTRGATHVKTKVHATPFLEFNLRSEIVFMYSMLRRAQFLVAPRSLNECLKWKPKHAERSNADDD